MKLLRTVSKDGAAGHVERGGMADDGGGAAAAHDDQGDAGLGAGGQVGVVGAAQVQGYGYRDVLSRQAIDRRHDGLGLISMEERARLINGRLTIQSEPRHGTTVAVRVPLNSVAETGNRTPPRELSMTDSLAADVDRDVGDRRVV